MYVLALVCALFNSPSDYLSHHHVGTQAILDLYDCKTPHIDHMLWVEQQIRTAAEKAGGHVVASDFHHFQPYGISGVVIISESHIAIHIWPEYAYCAIDMFTCAKDVGLYDAIVHLIKAFESEDHRYEIFDRGHR